MQIPAKSRNSTFPAVTLNPSRPCRNGPAIAPATPPMPEMPRAATTAHIPIRTPTRPRNGPSTTMILKNPRLIEANTALKTSASFQPVRVLSARFSIRNALPMAEGFPSAFAISSSDLPSASPTRKCSS